MTPQEQKNRQLVADFWHYTATGQPDKVITLLADDCVFKIGVGKSERVVPYHGVYQGLEEIKTYLKKSRKGRFRAECDVRPLVPDETPKPMKQEASPEGLLVQGNTVVGLAAIVELFPDRAPMDRCDAILLLKVDEDSGKIQFFQLFLDTAAPMIAHLNR